MKKIERPSRWTCSAAGSKRPETAEAIAGGARPALELRTTLGGEVMRQDTAGDLLVDLGRQAFYLSTRVSLRPGDVIATGTPDGVGHARRPPVHVQASQHIVTEIQCLGGCSNDVVADPAGNEA